MDIQTILAMFIGGFVLGYFLKSYLVGAYIDYRCVTCENNKEK
jgi:hypothetical protein